MSVNFDQKSINFVRYSMPTRVPAYMASGTPILVYGPADVAQVQYALQAGWGAVVQKQGDNALKEMLKNLVGNVEDRIKYSEAAVFVARRNHDKKIICNKLKKSLATLLMN